MPAAPLLSQLALVEALATASATTIPRLAQKNSRLLGPVEIEIERSAKVGGGTVWGANLNGRGNVNRADFVGDGVATTFDTGIPYAALANYNWLPKASKSTRTGTATIAAGSAAVTGSGTAFTTELAIGDEIQINGERKIVKAIASNTALTVTEAFQTSAAGATVSLMDGILVATTDFSVSNVGGFARITITAAAKLPSGATLEVHRVTPVELDSFADATVQFRRRDAIGKDVVWFASDATATPSDTSIYLKPIGQ